MNSIEETPTANIEYILKVENLVKTYKEAEIENHVLDGVSFQVEKGDFIAICGPSGSGKSTLLYTISGMDTANSGKILFEGSNLLDCSEEELTMIRRNRMGYVFQAASLLPNLNILDNIILKEVCRAKDKKKYEKKTMEQIVAKAKELMRQTGIEEIADRNIHKVSGGQLQRAGICRALMSDPEIIFADEPTGALNSESAKDIMDIFTKLNQQGKTIILVTHDPNVADRAKRILYMKDGRFYNE